MQIYILRDNPRNLGWIHYGAHIKETILIRVTKNSLMKLEKLISINKEMD